MLYAARFERWRDDAAEAVAELGGEVVASAGIGGGLSQLLALPGSVTPEEARAALTEAGATPGEFEEIGSHAARFRGGRGRKKWLFPSPLWGGARGGGGAGGTPRSIRHHPHPRPLPTTCSDTGQARDRLGGGERCYADTPSRRLSPSAPSVQTAPDSRYTPTHGSPRWLDA